MRGSMRSRLFASGENVEILATRELGGVHEREHSFAKFFQFQ